jgi:hypothetical protein
VFVYLYHLASPLGNERHQAQHYLGTAEDVTARDALHRTRRGARILAAAVERGIGFQIVRLWPGGRDVERWLKNRKEAAQLCPVCSGAAAWRRATVLPPTAVQLALPLDEDLPAPWEVEGYTPPSERPDWYEVSLTRRWRAARAVAVVAHHNEGDDDVLGLL